MDLSDLPTSVLQSELSGTRTSAAGPRDGAAILLSEVEVGGFATIHAVLPGSDPADRQLVLRLIELGFVPGERVRVMAAGRPGHEPIAVRLSAADSGRRSLNGATFAMRRHEADFIRVVRDEAMPRADA